MKTVSIRFKDSVRTVRAPKDLSELLDTLETLVDDAGAEAYALAMDTIVRLFSAQFRKGDNPTTLAELYAKKGRKSSVDIGLTDEQIMKLKAEPDIGKRKLMILDMMSGSEQPAEQPAVKPATK